MTTTLKPGRDAIHGMERLDGGLFVMGSDRHYPDEARPIACMLIRSGSTIRR